MSVNVITYHHMLIDLIKHKDKETRIKKAI